jgi:putative membrane protein
MNIFVSHWSANPVVLAACGVAVATHLLGMYPVSAGGKWPARPHPAAAAAQAAVFYCGLLAVVAALMSPVAYWAGRFIWIRSLQDALLVFAAPSLIVLGAPWLALRRGAARLRLVSGTGAAPAAPDAGQERRHSPVAAGRSRTAWPVVVTVAFIACWLGWHLPGGYDAALRHPAVHAAEVVTYLVVGIAFWLQVIGSGPFSPRLAPLARLALVVSAFVSVSVFSMVLIFSSGVMYPAYRGPTHHLLGVVADQQLGGAVLWTAALVPFGIAAVALCLDWLTADESQALDAGVDRLLSRRASAWPSRPGFR